MRSLSANFPLTAAMRRPSAESCGPKLFRSTPSFAGIQLPLPQREWTPQRVGRKRRRGIHVTLYIGKRVDRYNEAELPEPASVMATEPDALPLAEALRTRSVSM